MKTIEIIGKCPFFNETCLKESCTAYQLDEHRLWENLGGKDDPRYRHFPKRPYGGMFKKEDEDEEQWEAYNIPYCRTMGVELPIKVVEE